MTGDVSMYAISLTTVSLEMRSRLSSDGGSLVGIDSLDPDFKDFEAISSDFPNLRASCCVTIFFFLSLEASAAY